MSDPRFVICVDGLPSSDDQGEVLEFILAAVSLDVDVRLLVSPDALGLLSSPSTAAWRQLFEQKLIDVLVAGVPEELDPPRGIQRLSREEEAMVLRSSTVIRV